MTEDTPQTTANWIDDSVPLYTGMAYWPDNPPVEIDYALSFDRGDAANLFLLSTIQAVDSLVGTASRAAAGIIGSRTEAAEQHRAIVAAIGIGDVTQAQAAMELHINTFIHNYRRLVAKQMLPQDAAEVAG